MTPWTLGAHGFGVHSFFLFLSLLFAFVCVYFQCQYVDFHFTLALPDLFCATEVIGSVVQICACVCVQVWVCMAALRMLVCIQYNIHWYSTSAAHWPCTLTETAEISHSVMYFLFFSPFLFSLSLSHFSFSVCGARFLPVVRLSPSLFLSLFWQLCARHSSRPSPFTVCPSSDAVTLFLRCFLWHIHCIPFKYTHKNTHTHNHTDLTVAFSPNSTQYCASEYFLSFPHPFPPSALPPTSPSISFSRSLFGVFL